MKNFTKFLLTTILLTTSIITSSHSQGQVYDVVSIGPGYTNQTFYSMANGEISSVSNTNWDLAFQISGFQASILVNGKNNVRLFRSGLDANSWGSVTANDTVGMMNTANELFNQDTSWWAGAFNITADLTNQFDLGWGVYDLATHAVTGDSLFFIKLSTGVVKKIWIQSLANATYYFAYADVDGTNEINATLSKSAFPGKNFGYYSIINNTSLDREPNKYLWDLTFMQYVATTPFVYKVSGVLANDSVATVKTYPVDAATVTPWGAPFNNHIGNIGYDWKSYDFNNNIWAIEDSVVYFVYGKPGGLWKLIFTGFGGSSTGDFEFTKEQISTTGLNENGGLPAFLSMYPNPASANCTLSIYIEKYNPSNSIQIFDLTGKLVKKQELPNAVGLQQMEINTANLTGGVYLVRLVVDGTVTTQKLTKTN
jgi:hypothetical protein